MEIVILCSYGVDLHEYIIYVSYYLIFHEPASFNVFSTII